LGRRRCRRSTVHGSAIPCLLCSCSSSLSGCAAALQRGSSRPSNSPAARSPQLTAKPTLLLCSRSPVCAPAARLAGTRWLQLEWEAFWAWLRTSGQRQAACRLPRPGELGCSVGCSEGGAAGGGTTPASAASKAALMRPHAARRSQRRGHPQPAAPMSLQACHPAHTHVRSLTGGLRCRLHHRVLKEGIRCILDGYQGKTAPLAAGADMHKREAAARLCLAVHVR
jgi:hypothetical protein